MSTAVGTKHREYQASAWKWKRCRDVVGGKDAMLESSRPRNLLNLEGSEYAQPSASRTYLPALGGQSEEEYRSYCERAAFFNATGRTLDAFSGLIFAKDPLVKLPAKLEPYERDITLSGVNLREFSEQVVEQQLGVGRVGLLTDFPDIGERRLTQAESEQLNLRPFLRWYRAENIINWRTTTVAGKEMLSLVVLQESVEQQKNDFEVTQATQYRVLILEEGLYTVRLYNGEGEFIPDSERQPRANGRRLNFIPFTILGANSCEPSVQKPPLLDLVDVNIGHLRNSADYEHGLHFTGLPTPYVAGVQIDNGKKLHIGAMEAWVFPDPQANVGFLEFKGEGLKELRESMKSKEHRMAVLGARMLADEKRTAEAFGTIELKTAGERSALASAARAASDGIGRCLNWMALFVSAPEEAEFALNTDYGASRMPAEMLTATVGAYQSGAMPMAVFFENLQKGELVNPEMTLEEYTAMLEQEGPSIATELEEGVDDGGAPEE